MNRLALACSIALSLLGAHAGAQPCHAENDTPNFNDAVSMGGPNLLLAIRFTAPANLAVQAMEVFTGEGSGTNTIGIWSHNASANRPLASLSTGSWNMSATNSWQGASLPATVNLTGGTTYWVVWGCVNGSQAAVDVPTTTVGQVYRGSFDGGANWSGPFQSNDSHWKFRLICDQCSGFFLPYGSGCQGMNGVPVLAGAGCPSPGDTISIGISNGLANANGLMLLGLGTGSAAVSPACTIDNTPIFPATIPLALSAAGTLTFVSVLPLSTPTPGDLYLQAIFADAANPYGISATNALQMHVQ